MKKITLLAFSIFAFIATTFAQNIQNPTAVEFTTNPAKYNGATSKLIGDINLATN